MSQKISLEKLKEFDYYIAVVRGGMMPAFLLSKITDVRHIDTFLIRSYTEDHQQIEPELIEKDFSHISGKKVLIVDDLVDSGKTMQIVKEYIAKYNPAKLGTFVVFKKGFTKFDPDFYVKEMSGDEWINFKYDSIELDKMLEYMIDF